MVREFAGDPRVETFVMSFPETRETLSTFWTNLYLRGTMVFDPDGAFSLFAYSQPDTPGVAASRSFVIGPDQSIAFPFFGHDPTAVTNRIYQVLGQPKGDHDGDGDVDSADLLALTVCFTGEGGYAEPGCLSVDLDDDADVDCHDWYRFRDAWTEGGEAPPIDSCPQTVELVVGLDELVLEPIAGAVGYDVVHGDLLELRDRHGDYATALRGCLADDLVDSVVSYTLEPAPGSGAWFLARGVTVDSAMTYDTGAESQVGDRDVAIEGSPLACR
ncbi:MAG TPA: hypothetical protein VD788_10520 [Candidatus Polarisedimenticolaceae bacterium]|nr:hypothetical protein [Candidatus Polarisedimenticolaceae bacterium]